jgi:hypothetical protein
VRGAEFNPQYHKIKDFLKSSGLSGGSHKFFTEKMKRKMVLLYENESKLGREYLLRTI